MADIEWEYETFVDSDTVADFDIDDWLNRFGKEGWELVTMVPKDYRYPDQKDARPAGDNPWTFIFKRQVDYT